MTKEIGDIINAFKAAQREGRQAALATVVQVEGSSYRRPGARMLVEDNGRITGAISGGCLEGDALRKALQAMARRKNKLVTYDTLNEDDHALGVQLGCNGIVHILFEPIDPHSPDNPIALLESFYGGRIPVVLVTLFSIINSAGPQQGTCFVRSAEMSVCTIKDDTLACVVTEDATVALANGGSLLRQYATQELSAFIELVQPPVSLIIIGGGNDAQPVAGMAAILGWQITIIDGRPTHISKARFPQAHKLIAGKPGDAIKQVAADDRTAFVLMTHNYNYDLAMLPLLLQTNCRYIGTLGPRKRLENIFAELTNQGVHITEEQRALIYGPIGLDIGAETPEEIALSIIAEVKAVMAGHNGRSLRLRKAAIHIRPEVAIQQNIFHDTE